VVHFDLDRIHGTLHSCKVGTAFPTSDTVTEYDVAHPALFFIRLLERIRTESRALSETARALHAHRRSAQVFLLRLFVELVKDTQQDNPYHSDAIIHSRLAASLPQAWTTSLDFAQEMRGILTTAVAEHQAHWQMSLEGDHHSEHRFGSLVARNEAAFESALEWVSKSLQTVVSSRN